MGFFKRKENRAEAVGIIMEDSLLRAFLTGENVTKEMALQVPTVAGGIDLIANIISQTPIKLYRETEGKAEEITDDSRVILLNDETGDTLNANEFWHAIVRDYYVGKGGYAYINRRRGKFESLHYVDEEQIAVQKSTDPIFKDFNLLVMGVPYKPFDFFKILRNTKDGASGTPITKENEKLIATAYATLVFEKNMILRGGNKKGYLKAEKKIDETGMAVLKNAFAKMYSNISEGSENFVILNSGINFQESSNTSVEMQLNESKITNADEFAKLFHVSSAIMAGKATEGDTSNLAKLAAIPLMMAIQCALNKDLLLEKEKGEYYFAFDTKELLKGSMRERFEAYKIALEANFMQIDEVRFIEDLPALGLTWIKIGLQDVLYDPKTQTVYTPNTNKSQNVSESGLQAEKTEPSESEEQP